MSNRYKLKALRHQDQRSSEVSAIQAHGSTLQDLLSSLAKSLRYKLVTLRFEIFCGSYNVSPMQARGSTVSRSLSDVMGGSADEWHGEDGRLKGKRIVCREERMGWKRKGKEEERREGKLIGSRVCLESQACLLTHVSACWQEEVTSCGRSAVPSLSSRNNLSAC